MDTGFQKGGVRVTVWYKNAAYLNAHTQRFFTLFMKFGGPPKRGGPDPQDPPPLDPPPAPGDMCASWEGVVYT